MSAKRKAMIVSPAKAERLKRRAEQERRARRNVKVLLIGIAAAVAILFIVFCAWYSEWIKQPHETHAQEHQTH